MTTSRYAIDLAGAPIAAPPGWRILPEGEAVPHVHREFIRSAPYGASNRWSERWAAPRRGHSTMTALRASIWGSVIAYAVPVAEGSPS